MDRKLNVDYILALKKDEKGILYVEEVNITHPKDILQKLDQFEKKSYYDIFDVVDYVAKQNYDKRLVYSYCWSHAYKEAFVRHATFQPFIYMSNRLVQIELDKKWKNMYDDDIRGIKNRIELEYSSKKYPKRRMERSAYLSYIANLEKKMREEIEKEQNERRIEIRNTYIGEIRRYIYAMCYMQVLPTVKSFSLIYSSENIGWYRPDYTIADNVLISVRTNFCYGRSAYFHVNLNYKGINILPYSDIVTYFWSNMMDNVRYTKDYEPHRSNWIHALSFVEDVSNLITTDSIKFEKEWIIDQVENMMAGLKSINEGIDKYYEKQKEAKKKAEEEEEKAQKEDKTVLRIIRYRFIDDLTIKRHKMYEHETLLTIQVDKLSATLSLLDDLTAIQNIYSPILNHIETIIHYNKKLVPAIELCRDDLHSRLKILNERLKELQSQKDDVQNEMLSIKAEIDKRLEENNGTYQQWSTQNINKQNMLKSECEKDDQYKKLQDKLPVLTEKINTIQMEIRDRETFNKHLSERKEYIENKLEERKTSIN